MNSSKRFRSTLAAALFMALVTILSIFKGMETLASTSIAGIMTILSTYIWSQTKRPHTNEARKNSAGNPFDSTGNDRGFGTPNTI